MVGDIECKGKTESRYVTFIIEIAYMVLFQCSSCEYCMDGKGIEKNLQNHNNLQHNLAEFKDEIHLFYPYGCKNDVDTSYDNGNIGCLHGPSEYSRQDVGKMTSVAFSTMVNGTIVRFDELADLPIEVVFPTLRCIPI